MSEKVFFGNCKARTNKFGEQEVSIGFTADDIKRLEANLNEKGWVNVIQKSSKEGKPYIQLDTWTPGTAAATAKPAASVPEDEELPF